MEKPLTIVHYKFEAFKLKKIFHILWIYFSLLAKYTNQIRGSGRFVTDQGPISQSQYQSKYSAITVYLAWSFVNCDFFLCRGQSNIYGTIECRNLSIFHFFFFFIINLICAWGDIVFESIFDEFDNQWSRAKFFLPHQSSSSLSSSSSSWSYSGY